MERRKNTEQNTSQSFTRHFAAKPMKLTENLVEILKKPISPKNRFLVKVLPIFVFFVFFPALLFILPKFVYDKWLQLPTLFSFSKRIIPGEVSIVLGFLFLVTSTKAQRKIGKGTPMPLMATKKLVVEKPYSYCRNPLHFGLITFFFWHQHYDRLD